jgi:hypothetical protein
MIKTHHFGQKEELVTMANKKLIPIFLLSALMLTACSNEIIAKPGDYNSPLVVDAGTDSLASGVPNNAMSVIYDAIRDDGTLSSNVLNEVLYQLAISVIGRYKDETIEDPVSLKTAASKIDEELTSNPDVNKFLELHKSYWVKDEDGERKTDDASRKREYQKVLNAWNRIEKRVAEKVYDRIITGSYNDDLHRFSEESFLMSLINDNEKVADPTSFGSIPPGVVLHEKILLLPEVKKEDVFKEFVNLELLENDEKGYNFVSNSLIPEIYRQILVEQYLFDQSYNTIGRAYARKVNVISLSSNSAYPLLAGNLMNSYIDSYINTNDESSIAAANFDLISKAWRGVGLPTTKTDNPTTDEERAANLLLDADSINKSYVDSEGYANGQTFTYWQGTQYGKIIEDFEKIKENPLLDDAAIHADFTGSGTTKVGMGLSKKTNNVQLEDYTTDGFYIKNGGLTNTYEAIRTRLFNIGVANALDKSGEAYPDRFNDGVYTIPAGEGNYVCRINGRYYLKPSTSEKAPDSDEVTNSNYSNDFLWYNKDTATYYIVEVTEAVSSSKLSLTSDKNYEGIYGEVEGWSKMETISHDVAKVIAENDSYKSLSTQYWIKAAALAYHDDVIYNYFKDSFPDLFE